MDDYKKEVHQRFAEKFARFIVENDNVAQTAYPMMVAFLDTALDNLLVEVEGKLDSALNRHCSYEDRKDNSMYETGVVDGHRCAKTTALQALALFKGEDTSL